MAHLGVTVTFAGRVGARDVGYHRQELTKVGVRACLAVDLEADTGSIVIMVAPDGERTMFTDRGANHNLQKEDLPASLLDDADVLHLTGYSFCEPPLLEVALWLLGQARSRGLAVTVDPGSAAFLARMEPGAFLRWTDGAAVCFPNRDEAAVLVGEADPVTMATRLTRHYGVVALKLGAAGCLLAAAGRPPGPCRGPSRPRGEGHHRRGRRVLRCIHEPVARERPGRADHRPGQRGRVRRADRRLGRHPLRRSPRLATQRAGGQPIPAPYRR